MKMCKNQKPQMRHQRQKIQKLRLLGRPRTSAEEERFEREYDVEIKEGDEKGSKKKINGS